MAEATISDLMEEQKKVHEEFKKGIDRYEEETKKYGTALGETKQMLEKMEKRMDDIETRLNRPEPARAPKGESSDVKAAYWKYLRKGAGALSADEKKTLLVSDDTTGGFLAPSEMVAEIDKDVVEFSPMRAWARIQPTSSRSILVPRRTGVFAADWIGEGVSQSETTGLTYGMEEIHVHPLRALVRISLENLEDPIFNLEQELRAEFAEQFGVGEGTAFVNGNGVARPEGFITSTASGKVTLDTASSGVLVAEDIIKLVIEQLKSFYWPNAALFMHRKIIGAVRRLKDSDGQFLWQPGLNGTTQNTLLGFPVVEFPDMDDAVSADKKIIAFGDWKRAYRIVDRIQMSIIRDEFTLADQGLVRFIARKRVGGQIVRGEACAILNVKA